MLRIAVGDIMTRNFVHVNPEANLYDCSKKMARERVNSILIISGKKLVGILTARDILWLITKRPRIDLKSINIMSVATRKVAVIKPSADISQALKKMQAYNFRRLPVIANGQVIGIVTIKDILRVDPSLYAELGNLAQIREESRKLADTRSHWPQEGFCENCGAFSELLKVEGTLLCMDCRDELY